MENIYHTYQKFAEEGYSGIGSFISEGHHPENIIYDLLAYHIKRLDHIISSIKKQNSSFYEFFELLANYPDEIKFSRQLLNLREKPEMNLVFLYSIQTFKPIVRPLLISHFGLTGNPDFPDCMWVTFVESWYSALDMNDLTAKHMRSVAEETSKMINELNNLYKNE